MESFAHKRTKQIESGTVQKRKIIHDTHRRKVHIVEFEYKELDEEEIEVRKVEKVKIEVKEPTRRKPWNPKVETLNNPVINNGNFVQLNNLYDLYDSMDILQ